MLHWPSAPTPSSNHFQQHLTTGCELSYYKSFWTQRKRVLLQIYRNAFGKSAEEDCRRRDFGVWDLPTHYQQPALESWILSLNLSFSYLWLWDSVMMMAWLGKPGTVWKLWHFLAFWHDQWSQRAWFGRVVAVECIRLLYYRCCCICFSS